METLSENLMKKEFCKRKAREIKKGYSDIRNEFNLMIKLKKPNERLYNEFCGFYDGLHGKINPDLIPYLAVDNSFLGAYVNGYRLATSKNEGEDTEKVAKVLKEIIERIEEMQRKRYLQELLLGLCN